MFMCSLQSNMDSKYNSVGKEKENRNSFDIKVKRIKLNIENSNITVNDREKINGKLSNGASQNPKTHINNNTFKEHNDLQEERKTLPVYMVRGR